MNYGTNILIAWHMFIDWLKTTFGGGIAFPTNTEKLFPTAPGSNYNYVK